MSLGFWQYICIRSVKDGAEGLRIVVLPAKTQCVIIIINVLVFSTLFLQPLRIFIFIVYRQVLLLEEYNLPQTQHGPLLENVNQPMLNI